MFPVLSILPAAKAALSEWLCPSKTGTKTSCTTLPGTSSRTKIGTKTSYASTSMRLCPSKAGTKASCTTPSET